MKKLLLSLTIVSSLFLVSCEDEFGDNSGNTDNTSNNNNNGNNTGDGFWDVTCNSYYDSVAVTNCDSIWISDSTTGSYEVVCDTIVSYDSVQNQTFSVECNQVWVSNNSNNQNGYYDVDCTTSYEVKLIEECDSVWVDDSVNTTDSTTTGNGNNNGITGQWDYQCDSVMGNNQEWYLLCDSVWMNN